jgi:hypothetical protein
MDTQDVFLIGIAAVSIVIAIISVMASAWSYEKASEHERRMTEIAASMDQEVREMTAALRALSLDMRKMRATESHPNAPAQSRPAPQHAWSASGEPISDVGEEVALRAEEQRASAVKRVADQARGLSARAGATKEQAEVLAQGLKATVDETLSFVVSESERTREEVEERAVLETLFLTGGRRPMRIRDLADQIFRERRLDTARTLQAVERLHQANLLICDPSEGDAALDINRHVSITPNGILSVAA